VLGTVVNAVLYVVLTVQSDWWGPAVTFVPGLMIGVCRSIMEIGFMITRRNVDGARDSSQE
jgi:hypothetical protein